MANTVKTLIIQDMLNAISAIAEGETYSRTVRTAARYTLNPDPIEYDAVYVESLSEQKTEYSNVRHIVMTVTLACFVEEGGNIPVAVDALAADIEKALRVDFTRGNRAIDTQVTSVNQFVIEDVEPVGACTVDVQITFRHALNDPYTAVA